MTGNDLRRNYALQHMSGGRLEQDTCRDYVLPRLRDAGWTDDQIQEQYRITEGRIIAVGNRHRRGEALRADYALEYRPGLPIAVVEAKREHATPGKGMQQAKRYAQLLDVPFAYSTNGTGIVEDDRHTGRERDRLTAFPTPEELWGRYRAWKGLTDEMTAETVAAPFSRRISNSDGTVKEPRYYQRVAINRAIQAILDGEKRLLLTMATGTGKTFVATQIVWKLWNSRWRTDRHPRVLYLADRNILIDQPRLDYFEPVFGNGPIWRLRGHAKPGREMYFALYQSLEDITLYDEFAPDFFDLVDRGRVPPRQRKRGLGLAGHPRALLGATQLGMTATPKREETVDTYRYFGNPLFEYSLAQGIDDGFLAPYRVRRVRLSPDAHGWAPDPGQLDLFGHEIPPGFYTTKQFERVVSLLARTEAAAKHLTDT